MYGMPNHAQALVDSLACYHMYHGINNNVHRHLCIKWIPASHVLYLSILAKLEIGYVVHRTSILGIVQEKYKQNKTKQNKIETEMES